MLKIIVLCGSNGTFRSKTIFRIGHERKNVFFSFFLICVCACSIVRILATTLWKIYWLLGTFCSNVLRLNYEGKMA